ncbi:MULTISPECIES: hypothetical protein [unclassified Janthinobacterium]|uniref:hypothetical protein n=1 Tax=unclassified Janthinobacterium TaxID=2610881 RepID=UPI0017B89746|nr:MULTISPECIES: hypothetical protein [unclassified Janthinobacterium]MBB5610126.1 hypothetical protein [Janthinobacterium sp. S3T4]MBB5615524.1 hypothetical protein [Janthinobacterium sp. S3M3]
MSSSKSRGSRPSGPDLLGKSSMAAEGQRILSQLEHGVAPPAMAAPSGQRPAWWRPAGAALCVVLVALTLLILLSTRSGEENEPAAPAPIPTAVRVPTPAPATPPVAPATATIVNLAPPVPAPAVAVPAVKAAERKATVPERKAAARAIPSKPLPAGNSDGDVALLTAMVAHAHRQDGGRAEPLRDVVVRKEEEETVSLLQRCKQLGLIEGMLCRSRICSGRWDSDPACH